MAQQPPSDADVRDSEQRAAQETQRQQERERILREQRERVPEVSLPRPQVPVDEDDSRPDLPCFPIRQVVLKGGLAGDAAVQFAFLGPALEALQPGPERVCLGARGINRLMQRLQNQVVEHGYVTTRVLAEPQDLKTGTLTLTVLAGRVRAIKRDGEGSERATLWNALPTGPGRILDLRDIELYRPVALGVRHATGGMGRDLLRGDALDNFIEIHASSSEMKYRPQRSPQALAR